MKLAILSLAPSYPAQARKAISARWPNVDLDDVPVIIFYGYSWDGRLFDIPRDIPWQDLPLRRPVSRIKASHLSLRTGIRGVHNADVHIDTIRPILQQADEVLLLCYADFEAIGGANSLLIDVFGKIPADRIVFPRSLFDWNAPDDVDHMSIMADAGYFEQEAGATVPASQTADYFDYNYVLNATPILGLAARSAGLKGTAPSAFGLQLLYWLSENGGTADAYQLRNAVMAGWKGLGKYTDGMGMGSIRSRHAIIERLVTGGYLTKGLRSRDLGMVSLSDRGRRFLSLLHKDCRDPDLPFRIRQWATMPEAAARSRIDGYIKAFFGKQARMTRLPADCHGRGITPPRSSIARSSRVDADLSQ